MSALRRFVSLGLADADAKVAGVLAPTSSQSADDYLASSVVCRSFDAATMRVRDWWLASTSAVVWRSALDEWRSQQPPTRYVAIATTMLTAAAVHVFLTLINGARPGWFSLIIPAMVLALGSVILLGSRTRRAR
jgi:hypothetical protein